MDDDNLDDGSREEAWRIAFKTAEETKRALMYAISRTRASDKVLGLPIIRFDNLDTQELYQGLPGGQTGLGNFEIFMRHCEAWRLSIRGEAM